MLIVDDGSIGGTRELLRARAWPDRVRVLYHDRNRGKGAAIRTALGEARGKYAAIMDADLEYDAGGRAPACSSPLRSGDARAVCGTRAFQSRSAFSFWYVGRQPCGDAAWPTSSTTAGSPT